MTKKSLDVLQPARLDGSKFRQLYASLFRCRMLLEKLNSLKEPASSERTVLLQAGHEAIEAGLLIDLFPEDRVAPGSHSATARLLRGEPARSIIRETLGTEKASASSRANQAAPSTIPSCVSLGGQINLAVGAAWAFKTRGDIHIAVSFCKEGAVAYDVWNEAVQFSVLHKLPIVYVVHALAEEPATGGSSANTGVHLGRNLPVLIVDGDDAVAMYRAGQEAVRRARQGRGPCVVRSETSRRLDSSALLSDTPQPPEASTDPIPRLEMYLRQKGYWSEKWKLGLVASFTRELTRAVEGAEKTHLRVLRSDRSVNSVLASVG